MRLPLRPLLLVGLSVLLLAACNGDDDAEPTPTATETPTPIPTEQPAVSDCDARGYGDLTFGEVVDDVFVCIDTPLPDDTVAGALVVSGWSAGAFEANLGVRLLAGDGTLIAQSHTTVVQPDIGLFAGPYSLILLITDAPATGRGTLHVEAESPRDGSIAFDATIEVVFGP